MDFKVASRDCLASGLNSWTTIGCAHLDCLLFGVGLPLFAYISNVETITSSSSDSINPISLTSLYTNCSQAGMASLLTRADSEHRPESAMRKRASLFRS